MGSSQARAPPSTDGMATLGQLEDLKRMIEIDLRSLEGRMMHHFDVILFARMQEMMATRYEARFETLDDAVEALRQEVNQLRDVWSKLESTRSQVERRSGRTNPATGAGSAPLVRKSTPDKGDVSRR